MADIQKNLILIKHGGALLAFRRDEYVRAVKRGKYIKRCDSTERRAEKRLEKTRREGGRDSY
ncbi:MAG: hypothetical protein ACOC78_00325 [Actinomycetota bacterium]